MKRRAERKGEEEESDDGGEGASSKRGRPTSLPDPGSFEDCYEALLVTEGAAPPPGPINANRASEGHTHVRALVETHAVLEWVDKEKRKSPWWRLARVVGVVYAHHVLRAGDDAPPRDAWPDGTPDLARLVRIGTLASMRDARAEFGRAVWEIEPDPTIAEPRVSGDARGSSTDNAMTLARDLEADMARWQALLMRVTHNDAALAAQLMEPAEVVEGLLADIEARRELLGERLVAAPLGKMRERAHDVMRFFGHAANAAHLEVLARDPLYKGVLDGARNVAAAAEALGDEERTPAAPSAEELEARADELRALLDRFAKEAPAADPADSGCAIQ